MNEDNMMIAWQSYGDKADNGVMDLVYSGNSTNTGDFDQTLYNNVPI